MVVLFGLNPEKEKVTEPIYKLNLNDSMFNFDITGWYDIACRKCGCPNLIIQRHTDDDKLDQIRIICSECDQDTTHRVEDIE